MPATITAADNRDGTGVTVTVTGTGGVTCTVQGARLDGAMTAGAWAAVGSVVGSGSFTAAVATGAWFFVATGSDGSVSRVIYALVTNATAESLQDRVEKAILAKMITLAYAGVKQIKRVDLPAEKEVLRVEGIPCILLTKFRLNETYQDATNAKDDVGLPVMALYIFPEAWGDGADPRPGMWREITRRNFRAQRLPGLAPSEGYTASIEAGPLGIIDVSDANVPLKSSSQIIRVLCREARGA